MAVNIKSRENSFADPWVNNNKGNKKKSDIELRTSTTPKGDLPKSENNEVPKPPNEGDKVPTSEQPANDNKNDNSDTNIDGIEKRNTMSPDDELDELDRDLLLTEEEKEAFDLMLEQKREDIVNRKEKFEKWVDSITRRRMFALSRMRKIKISQGSRLKFYNKIDDYIEEANLKLRDVPLSQNSTNKENQETPTVTPNINSSNSRSENIVSSENVEREQTGFVLKDDEQTKDSSNLNTQSDQNLPIIVPVPS